MLVDAVDPVAGQEELPIERNWGMLNYLLTENAGSSDMDIANFLLSDWEELAPEVHRIPSDAVARIALWLSSITNETAIQKFDSDAMVKAGIYDADLALAEPGAYKARMARLLTELRAFLARATTSQASIIRVIA